MLSLVPRMGVNVKMINVELPLNIVDMASA